MNMFCYQCEQAAQGVGCTRYGVCGKSPEASALQDLLLHACKGIAMYAHRARGMGAHDPAVDRFVIEALFSTVTNVDFDESRLEALLRKAARVKARSRQMYEEAVRSSGNLAEPLSGPALWEPAPNRSALIEEAAEVGIPDRLKHLGPDRAGLQELLAAGLKGTAAYTHHAFRLGNESNEVYGFFHETLDFLAHRDPPVESLIHSVLQCGAINLRVMAMLDAAHRSAFGDPQPTRVRIEPRRGKAIAVSGHDLLDLRDLLEQTTGTGVQVYTHGEMLPAHGYPGLRRYSHLVGNYGGAWQDQQKEFDDFPGAVLMTTNCIQCPRESYRGRLFTTGLVGWPGVTHVDPDDFSRVIHAAQEAPGFQQDGSDRSILVGFGHTALLNLADRLVEALRARRLRHLFLIGGCDGAKPGRNYYTQFAEAVPQDCLILTLACGKYRFNRHEFGEIEGIPRLLDFGQCNDAYSAIRVTQALAEIFEADVNRLPLSLVLSWYEQKAVAVLLSLLALGIRNIRLGPSLPAFITGPVLQTLEREFGLKPITTVEADLKVMLEGECETSQPG